MWSCLLTTRLKKTEIEKERGRNLTETNKETNELMFETFKVLSREQNAEDKKANMNFTKGNGSKKTKIEMLSQKQRKTL